MIILIHIRWSVKKNSLSILDSPHKFQHFLIFQFFFALFWSRKNYFVFLSTISINFFFLFFKSRLRVTKYIFFPFFFFFRCYDSRKIFFRFHVTKKIQKWSVSESKNLFFGRSLRMRPIASNYSEKLKHDSFVLLYFFVCFYFVLYF